MSGFTIMMEDFTVPADILRSEILSANYTVY